MYIPLEDNPSFLARRMFNIISDREVSTFKDESDWEALKGRVRDFPFYMYMAQSKFNLQVFKDIIEKGKKIYNINVFVLDHLHFLIQGIENNTEEVGYLMREIVNIARAQNVTVFLVSHIRKKIGEGAWTKMPDMNALRSSGLIKGDAHMVIMLFKHFENEKMIIDLAVQKNREGNITLEPITFEFDTNTGIIREQTDEEKNSSLPKAKQYVEN
jgi:replicative DNA helicase